MPQAVAQRLFEQFGLRYAEGYGLTETAAPSHNNPADAPKQQCLGIPFLSTDARVVDPDTLQEMPQGEAGEIIIRGPSADFSAYTPVLIRRVSTHDDGYKLSRHYAYTLLYIGIGSGVGDGLGVVLNDGVSFACEETYRFYIKRRGTN